MNEQIIDDLEDWGEDLNIAFELSWRIVHGVWFVATLLLIGLQLVSYWQLFASYTWTATVLGPFFIYLLSFGLLTWLLIRQVPREEDSWNLVSMRLLANAALAGFMMGVGIALFKLIWYHQLWSVFNILTEPILLAFIGIIISGVLGWTYFQLKH